MDLYNSRFAIPTALYSCKDAHATLVGQILCMCKVKGILLKEWSCKTPAGYARRSNLVLQHNIYMHLWGAYTHYVMLKGLHEYIILPV